MSADDVIPPSSRPLGAVVRRVAAAALGGLLAGLAANAAIAAEPPGDPALGAKLYLQCRACHTVGAADRSGVGPNLYGVMGAKAAGKPGYKYSTALAGANLTWTPQTMDAWLKKPTAVAPGTKMTFAGVAAPKARQDLIAYLTTLAPPAKTRR